MSPQKPRPRPRRPIGKNRRIRVYSKLRAEPDVELIAKAIVSLAIAEAEAGRMPPELPEDSKFLKD